MVLPVRQLLFPVDGLIKLPFLLAAAKDKTTLVAIFSSSPSFLLHSPSHTLCLADLWVPMATMESYETGTLNSDPSRLYLIEDLVEAS